MLAGALSRGERLFVPAFASTHIPLLLLVRVRISAIRGRDTASSRRMRQARQLTHLLQHRLRRGELPLKLGPSPHPKSDRAVGLARRYGRRLERETNALVRIGKRWDYMLRTL